MSNKIKIFLCRPFSKSVISIITICIGFLSLVPLIPFVKLFKCNSSAEIELWNTEKCNPDIYILTNVIYSAYFVIFSKDDYNKVVLATQEAFKSKMEKSSMNNINVIIVIGESFNKYHSSLYNYIHNTNPYLCIEKKKGNLFVFNNVVSPYNMTSQVIKNVFSTNSLMENEFWYEKPLFPVIFKKAGYKVYFWDNQKSDAKGVASDYSLNSSLYNPQIARISYNYVNKRKFEYDEELINDFKKNVVIKNRNNLCIFHLMGQHLLASDRYPHNRRFCHFNVDSVSNQGLSLKEKQYVSNYDNATYYNDFILKSIIDIFRNTNTILVYFSDHGEEVYDYRHVAGRTHENRKNHNILKYQYEIPFVIWCSNEYKAQNKDIIGMIEKSLNKPYMTDNVSHLLFTLGHIHTQYYKSECDLLSPQYKCKKRIVQDHYDYDKIISSK